MQGFAEQKAVGGKLVKAQIEFGLVFEKVRFFGDFFLHPEDTISAIEQSIAGLSSIAPKQELEQKIAFVLAQNNAELVGATASDFAGVVLQARQNAKQ